MLSNTFLRSRKISKTYNFIIKHIIHIDYGAVNRAYIVAYLVSTTYLVVFTQYWYLYFLLFNHSDLDHINHGIINYFMIITCYSNLHFSLGNSHYYNSDQILTTMILFFFFFFNHLCLYIFQYLYANNAIIQVVYSNLFFFTIGAL